MTEKERKSLIDAHLVGIYNLSPAAKEPFFGKSPCPCCKSPLKGERYEFTGKVGCGRDTKETVTEVCCVDCFEYLFT